jgi:hypothetical protein
MYYFSSTLLPFPIALAIVRVAILLFALREHSTRGQPAPVGYWSAGPRHVSSDRRGRAPILAVQRYCSPTTARLRRWTAPALERDEFKFNVNFIVGGQVRGRD